MPRVKKKKEDPDFIDLTSLSDEEEPGPSSARAVAPAKRQRKAAAQEASPASPAAGKKAGKKKKEVEKRVRARRGEQGARCCPGALPPDPS